jgi:hypothetical protein
MGNISFKKKERIGIRTPYGRYGRKRQRLKVGICLYRDSKPKGNIAPLDSGERYDEATVCFEEDYSLYIHSAGHEAIASSTQSSSPLASSLT